MGIMEVFLDTILICTLTALVILVSGIPIPYGVDAGAELTTLAFAAVYGDSAALLIAAALILFAVATVLGWGLYGVRCAEFLFGIGAWKGFVFFQMAVIVLSSVLDTATVWKASETINGLMAIPNLIMLAVMAPELVRLTKEYKKSGKSVAGGGTYANFYQCKPL
jgi:AGCS family alanine or glycine:cation symporter